MAQYLISCNVRVVSIQIQNNFWSQIGLVDMHCKEIQIEHHL